nr:MAG TPA: hypothetical protein [Caudoviricetes sp.]
MLFSFFAFGTLTASDVSPYSYKSFISIKMKFITRLQR